MRSGLGNYDELLKRIAERIGHDRIPEIEERVNRLVSEDPRLSRLGALYLVIEELGGLERTARDRYFLPISKVVGGLRDVNVRGRVIGVKTFTDDGEPVRAYLRLGDNTGVINCAVWGSLAKSINERGVTVGVCVQISNAYSRERLDGNVELHLNENAGIDVIEGHEIPPLGDFFRPLDEVVKTRGDVDFKAVLLAVSDVRSVGSEGELKVMDVLLGYGKFSSSMTVWRESVLDFSDLRRGDVLYVAGAKCDHGFLSTISRTHVYRVDERDTRVTPPTLLILDRVELEDLGPATYIASDSSTIRLVTLEDGSPLEPGVLIDIRSEEYLHYKGRWVMRVKEYAIRGDVDATTWFDGHVTLGELRDGMNDVVVDGILESKIPLSVMRTRRGYVDTVTGWLRSGNERIFCLFWGNHARIIDGIPNGTPIRLRWVQARANRYGELEVHVDGYSKIDVIQGGSV
ncbi:MAG: hypothetical protein NZ920_03020 [Aigarchaeota archaeon]|nr:hypothetical protein [Aigarchaeota archaeon]MDW8092405.1 hypothetical protein [Nitrososphaerota archaeon]